jgi:3-deoxy-7-phosphoheptulonate synthase
MKVQMIQLAKNADVIAIKATLTEQGQWTQALKDKEGHTYALSIDPSSPPLSEAYFKSLEGVVHALGKESSHPRIDTLAHTPFNVANFTFNQNIIADRSHKNYYPLMISGPCSVESQEIIIQAARMTAQAGGRWLRGGAFKPRTSPYSFQGIGEEALQWMRHAADMYQLQVVSEALSEYDVELVSKYADLIQVGTRNMQNFALLKAVGRSGKPVMLKRGLCASIDEWLLAGEYLMHYGSSHVIFCERGLRGFDNQTRNLLDLGAVALLKHTYGLPVIVDPSHAAGRKDLIIPLSLAAIAAGADGIMVEAHPSASQARSDGPQALDQGELRHLAEQLGIPPIHIAQRNHA